MVNMTIEEIHQHRDWRKNCGRSMAESPYPIDRLTAPAWSLVGGAWEALANGATYERAVSDVRAGWDYYVQCLSPEERDKLGTDFLADVIEVGLDSVVFRIQRRQEEEARVEAHKQELRRLERARTAHLEPVPITVIEQRQRAAAAAQAAAAAAVATPPAPATVPQRDAAENSPQHPQRNVPEISPGHPRRPVKP
jgi:hypothetical protein